MKKQEQTFVKVCGITRLGDARAAVRAGANAVGFIFAKSPRRVSVSQASSIVPHVHPALEKIGVFVNSSLEKVLDVVATVGLTGVQLQGDEDEAFVSKLKDAAPRLFVSKVIRITGPGQVNSAAAMPSDAIMIDAKDPAEPERTAGTIPAEWIEGSRIPKLIVAGGLTPSSVAEVIRSVRPFGVDVSSGVEVSPGKKDPALISQFVRAVRAADAAT